MSRRVLNALGGIEMLPERLPEPGELVGVRSRGWLVEKVSDVGPGLPVVSLAGADDDAQGEQIDVLWDYEIDRRILLDEGWGDLAARGFDDPRYFAAFLNTLRWGSVTATDPSLFQAPFRAGIKIEAYQMVPLRKALLLPRANLFIADDTGLGKTIEAGLIARELLLRKKATTIVVAAPPSVLEQRQAELDALEQPCRHRGRVGLHRPIVLGRPHKSPGPTHVADRRLTVHDGPTIATRLGRRDMPRRPIIITSAVLAAALAAGAGSGAAAQSTTPQAVTCTLELFAQGPPNPGATPSGIQFGLVACPRPFGKGVHYDAYTVTPTGPRHGTIVATFKNYFDRGTRSGTATLTVAATSSMNITYTGTVTFTGGTGKFKHLKGSGTIQCTSTDGGAHKSCTVTSTLAGT